MLEQRAGTACWNSAKAASDPFDEVSPGLSWAEEAGAGILDCVRVGGAGMVTRLPVNVLECFDEFSQVWLHNDLLAGDNHRETAH